MSLDLEFPDEPTGHAWAKRKAADALPRHWVCIQCGDRVFHSERPEPGLCTRKQKRRSKSGGLRVTQQQLDDARPWFYNERSGGYIEWPGYQAEMMLFEAAELEQADVDGVLSGTVLALDTEAEHFDIETRPDGSFEWFWRERATGNHDGGDGWPTLCPICHHYHGPEPGACWADPTEDAGR